METIRVTLKGTMPLLMHADNIEWADKMEAWRKEPDNKALSKAGDDRTPAWRWLGCLNHDDSKTGVVTIPSDYIMSCMMGGGALVPTGKGQTTFKALSQSGLLCSEFHWPLLVNGKPIAMKDVGKLRAESVFAKHVEAVEALGFSLFVKRAKIGASKHIRVRPRFDNWSATGEISILNEQITRDILVKILTQSGRFKGLGDWRPGGKTPGPWGTFEAKIA
jgi:hypothetical protein